MALLLSLFVSLSSAAYALAEDTVCYNPTVFPDYKYGPHMMYKELSRLADSMGLFKLNFVDVQRIKIYVVTDTNGRNINVINAGCEIDSLVEKIVTATFLKIKDFKPGTKAGQPLLCAKLYEFSIYPNFMSGNRYDVRVKLEEIKKSKDKDFAIFISMFEKWIKKETFFPKNYKVDKLDGLVKVEFSFNKKGKATGFKILQPDKDEFIENSLITLFSTKAISPDYIEMIGPDKKFIASFDYVSFADLDGFLPSNH